MRARRHERKGKGNEKDENGEIEGTKWIVYGICKSRIGTRKKK